MTEGQVFIDTPASQVVMCFFPLGIPMALSSASLKLSSLCIPHPSVPCLLCLNKITNHSFIASYSDCILRMFFHVWFEQCWSTLHAVTRRKLSSQKDDRSAPKNNQRKKRRDISCCQQLWIPHSVVDRITQQSISQIFDQQFDSSNEQQKKNSTKEQLRPKLGRTTNLCSHQHSP